MLVPALVVSGLGMGAFDPARAALAIGVTEPAESGVASGVNETFQQVGIAGIGACRFTVPVADSPRHRDGSALSGNPSIR